MHQKLLHFVLQLFTAMRYQNYLQQHSYQQTGVVVIVDSGHNYVSL